MTRGRWSAALIAGCALVAAARDARATPREPEGAPEASAPSGLTLTAAPMFGADAATGSGWTEIVVHLEASTAGAQRGTLDLAATTGTTSGGTPLATAPFNVPAGRSAIVKVPIHALGDYSGPIAVTARGDTGAKIGATALTPSETNGPLLVDVHQPSRLGIVLRGWPIAARWNPGSRGMGYASSALTVGAPAFDHATGDPILPDRAAAYAAVTVVVIHAEVLAGLDAETRDALVGWVTAGGTLAVIASRPEDLRAPVITTIAGGAVRPVAPDPAWASLPVVERPATAAGIGEPPAATEETPAEPSAPGGPIQLLPAPAAPAPPAAPGAPPRTSRLGPTPPVHARLKGFAGGALATSDFGASAAFGAGEVHLLAWDPTGSPEVEDPWVHSRVTEMVARAWDRRAARVFFHGVPSADRMEDVRRVLDPNENFRAGLGFSAILLVLYAVVAGPLTFLRAARKGDPLAPLKWAPIWSAAAFGAIVLTGLAGKGWRGRARHLALIEAHGGAPRGTARTFRAFFASRAGALAVPGGDAGAVLEAVALDSARDGLGVLRVDRARLTLSGLASLPWQTVVVREDAPVDVKGGVSLTKIPDGGYEVTNHTGRTLKDIVIHAPGDSLRYVTTLAEGETVRVDVGRPLVGTSSGVPYRATTAGAMDVHPLGARDIQALMGGRDGERVASTWEPMETAAGDGVDWWPEDDPALIAEMVGVPMARDDAGLRLESERTLLRVVGAGGAP